MAELATMAEIEVADLAAFSDADFDELTTGLGIPVGARLKLRTQWHTHGSGRMGLVSGGRRQGCSLRRTNRLCLW